ncbi:hypothetical protein Tco_1224027 [Tanacetum coccineum]
MNVYTSIYRELKKISDNFSNLPFNVSRRSFFFNLWPFDDVDEVLGPIKRCHVGEMTCREINTSDSEEEEDSKKDEIYLKALDNNEIESFSLKRAKFENSSYFLQEISENQISQKDKKGLGFTKDRASTSEVKTKKIGQESGKTPTVELAEPIPSAREPASSNEGDQPPAKVCGIYRC